MATEDGARPFIFEASGLSVKGARILTRSVSSLLGGFHLDALQSWYSMEDQKTFSRYNSNSDMRQ